MQNRPTRDLEQVYKEELLLVERVQKLLRDFEAVDLVAKKQMETAKPTTLGQSDFKSPVLPAKSLTQIQKAWKRARRIQQIKNDRLMNRAGLMTVLRTGQNAQESLKRLIQKISTRLQRIHFKE